MPKNTVLFISEELPLPHQTGYSTYNHAFLTGLQAGGYEVHLVITGNRFPSAFFNVARRLGMNDLNVHIPQAINLSGSWYIAKPMGLLKVAYRRLSSKFPGVKKWLNRRDHAVHSVVIGRWLDHNDLRRLTPILASINPDLALVDTLFRSPSLTILADSCRKYLIGHDVFSQRCLSLAEHGFQPCPWVSQEDETAALQTFDAVFAITDADAAEYQSMAPDCRVIPLPSPVTPELTTTERPNSNRIFYLGSQAHHNVDGLEWFLTEVWPLVLQENPALSLDVVGSIGASISSNHLNTYIHGRLDDFSSLAEQAMFAINPVRAGSGMKIKILDYLAHGLACITTSVGVAGFPEQPNRPITVCDEAMSFASTILAWSGDTTRCSQLSAQALDYVKQFSSAEFNSSMLKVLAGCPDDTKPAV